MSGNPFRRQRLPDETTKYEANGDISAETKPKTKKKKKVVIQTPPHSPDEPKASIPRRLSDGLTGSPPAPTRRLDDDESDSMATTADSDLEHTLLNTSRNTGPPPISFGVQSGSRAPYNPFAKTLATSEAAYGRAGEQELSEEMQEANGVTPRSQGTGRPALDVDTFKNILLTGSATPSPPNGGTASQRPQDSSSNTDTSSVSKQSMFDNMNELHPESPRTSFDDHYGLDDEDDGDDENSSLMGPASRRPVAEGPPAPPKPKHGRAFPQTVSFADFDETIPATDMPTPTRLQTLSLNANPLDRVTAPRSPSDLNKPLPPPPAGRVLVDEALTSTSQPISTNGIGVPTDDVEPTIQVKKAPPPPPIARRRAQPDAETRRARSDSNLSKSSAQAADANTSLESQGHKALAPPPPPSRRAQSTRSQSPAAETSPSPTPSVTKGMPPPLPRRMPSQRGSSAVRTSSNASRVSLPRSDSFTMSAAHGNAPPAPPPRRTAGSKRDSMENGPPNSMSNRRPSHENRRSSGQSFGSDREPSLHSLQQVQEPEHGEDLSPAGGEVKSTQPDYLADLDAFQKEIDALRAQAARNG
ncbi:hypothetical protein LTR78_002782 [Recurvomyces mirabilis]|uniref:Uncharacterized protein n=1 Tax=Recurvomyces mirabilis TaxID=574656 RepID=A0AAE1C3W9_9PEZI|nr:hypothetical protein LTR78_002782 [Recurvomyces mirabilis]KAK5159484.1 hypothetical protein LTS14_002626 [Recurvomyces mirabilis]